MPKVPEYRGGVSQRALGTNYSDQRHSPSEYGADVGNALSQVGGALNQFSGQMAQLARKKQDEDDAFAVEKADLEFGRVLSEQLHSEKSGFLNRQGENALDYSEQAKAIGAARERLTSTLTERQAQRFNLRAELRSQQATTRMEEHVSREKTKAMGEIADGAFGLAMEQVKVDHQNPDLVASHISKLFVGPDQDADGNAEPGPVRSYFLRRGMPMEKAIVEEKKMESRLMAEAVSTFLENEDGVGAHNFMRYPGVKERLGPLAEKMEKQIRPVLVKQEGNRIAKEAVAQSMNDAGWLDEPKARTVLAGIEDEEIRDATEKRLNDLSREERQRKDTVVQTVFNRALGAYLQRRNATDINAMDMGFLNDGMNDPLAGLKLARIIESDQERERAKRAGRQMRAPSEMEVRQMADFIVDASKNPEKYLGMKEGDLHRDVYSKLAPSQWDDAARLVAGLTKRAGDPDERLGQLESAYLIELGQKAGYFGSGKLSDWKPEQVQKLVVANSELLRMSNDHKARTGKAPDLMTVQAWATDLLMRPDVKQPWWRPNTKGDSQLDRILKGEAAKAKAEQVEDIDPVPSHGYDVNDPQVRAAGLAFYRKHKREPTPSELKAELER